ncbi:MAG: InlB B-repeat-containing protein [Bacteroidaceae bacterium]|nr:InlB B-repeat-containing protein [Bacteroidaceae bacterium]
MNFRRLLKSSLISALFMCGVAQGWADPTQDANGYYLLGSASDLTWFANHVNNGYVNANAKLTANIDMKGVTWGSIGNVSYNFQGIIDGQGYIISNLTNGNAGGNDHDRGLVGRGSGCTIKNIILNGGSISAIYRVSPFLAYAPTKCTIENCGVIGTWSFENSAGYWKATGGLALCSNIYNSFSVYKEVISSDTDGYQPESTNCQYEVGADYMASGKLCYDLNSNGNSAWLQTLGKDTYPVLRDAKAVKSDGTNYYNEYTVTFNTQGGSACAYQVVKRNQAGTLTYGTLPTPTRSGYNFKGWFTAATNGTEVTSATVFNGFADVTLYAQWEEDAELATPTAGGKGYWYSTKGDYIIKFPATISDEGTVKLSIASASESIVRWYLDWYGVSCDPTKMEKNFTGAANVSGNKENGYLVQTFSPSTVNTTAENILAKSKGHYLWYEVTPCTSGSVYDNWAYNVPICLGYVAEDGSLLWGTDHEIKHDYELDGGKLVCKICGHSEGVEAHNGSDDIVLTQNGDEFTASRLDLEDNKNFSTPVDFKVNTFTYSRNNSNRWGTICLPVEIKSSEKVQYYLAGVVEGGILTLEPVSKVPAGKPAVYQILSGLNSQNKGSISVSLANAKVVSSTSSQVSDIELCGTFTAKSLTEEGLYYISNNKFWLKTEGTPLTVNPFRAWFKVRGSASNARARMIDIQAFDTAFDSEEATSIVDIDSVCSGDAEIFSASGAKLNDMQKGVNIVKYSNGKTIKIIVK